MPNLLVAETENLHLFMTDDLYIIEEMQSEPEKLNLRYLGGNQRHILVLVFDEENEIGDDNSRELLKKILKAINLSTPDFALLNYADYREVSFKKILAELSSKIVFAFGVPGAMLNMPDSQEENVLITETPVELVYASGLSDLSRDPLAKKKLWGCLKNLSL